jgi:hypothetical protein
MSKRKNPPKEIPTDRSVTFQHQFRKCGKPSCGTCQRTKGHGPYWYAYWRIDSRLVSRYMGKNNPKSTGVGNLPKTVVQSEMVVAAMATALV